MRSWLYPFVLCLAGAWAASNAASAAAGAAASAAPVGLQPGWRFQVVRLFEREGEAWLGILRSPSKLKLELGFVEEIGRVVANRPTQVIRTGISMDGDEAAHDSYHELMGLEECELNFRDGGFELIDRLSGGKTVTSLLVRNTLGWPLAPDLWPQGPLQVGQAWNYRGTDLVRRLGMLEVVHGQLDLRVASIQREPRTGLDTAHIRGRLRAHIPMFGVPLLYEARVEIDLPPALGIPFRMEFNGRISGEGRVAGEDGTLETLGVDATYRVVQLVSPSRTVLAELSSVSTTGSGSPVPKERPEPLVPAPAAKVLPVAPVPVAPLPPKRSLTRGYPDVDRRDERGATPLIMAAMKGNLAEMQELMKRGADLNALDNRGNGALVYAASVGELEAVRLLLNSGANPNVRSPDGDTPIVTLAAWKDIHGEYGEGILQAIGILLDANADVNAADDEGNTALMRAAHVNNARLVKLLLERGADPTSKDKDGVTARRVAEILGNGDVLPLLPLDPMQSGGKADVSVDARNEKGSTRLMLAAIRGELANVRDLLRRGADPNARDLEGRNPVFYSAVGTEPEVLRLLLEKGGDPNQRSNSGESPLIVLATSQDFGGESAAAYLATVERLLEGGADPNARHKDRMTPMMYAALHGNTGLVKLLLKHGADINAKNKDGVTAVVIAHSFGHQDIVEMLLAAGAETGSGKAQQ